jgi:hypothetical protein
MLSHVVAYGIKIPCGLWRGRCDGVSTQKEHERKLHR